MSISYLLSSNDYMLYAKDISSNTIQLSNTTVYTVDLVYLQSSSYIVVASNIDLKTTLIGKFVFIEVPEITCIMPSDVFLLYFTQSNTSTNIFFPFQFKYNSYQPGYFNNTLTDLATPIVFRSFVGNNSPIQLRTIDNVVFSSGTSRFIPTLIMYVIN